VADPPRKRRWPIVLTILAVLLAGAAWWVDRQLEPTRLAATVLSRASAALGLELSIDGTPDYALRPEPRLRLPRLLARQPGAAAPLLRAESVDVSLPWSTLRNPETVVVTRVALVRPQLDTQALAQWLSDRPAAPGPFEFPTITDGLQVTDGLLVGDTWSLRGLDMQLQELRPDAPATLDASGTFVQGALALEFAATLALPRASLASPYSLQADGRIRKDDFDRPYALTAAGQFDLSGDVLSLQANTVSLRAQSPLPDLDAKGALSWGEQTLGMSLGGRLMRWPADWPALPAPLVAERGADFSIDYGGPADFSADASLQIRQDETRLDASLSLARFQAWLADTGAGPLPPLVGSASTPRLEIGGATLEGVSIGFEDTAAAEAEPEP
jgi:uncharacterized protein involved in outer membrane biogenesis